jgi:hypothetical protein
MLSRIPCKINQHSWKDISAPVEGRRNLSYMDHERGVMVMKEGYLETFHPSIAGPVYFRRECTRCGKQEVFHHGRWS